MATQGDVMPIPNQFVGPDLITDANAFLTGGVRLVNADTTNLPVNNVGLIVNFVRFDGEQTNWIIQFYAATYNDVLYYRTHDNLTWKSWKQF